MPDEAPVTNTTEGGVGTPGSSVLAPVVPAAVPAVQQAAPAAIAPQQSAPKLAKPLGDDVEDVSNEELYSLKGSDFKRRMDRYSSKQLKDKFGTDNYDDIKTKLDKLNTLEAQQEEQRRASMAESDRLKEDIAKANARATAAESALKNIQRKGEVSKELGRLKNLATKHIDMTMVKYALPEFVAYAKKLSRREMDGLQDKDIELFFRDLAKRQPRFGKGASKGPAPAPVPRVGVTTTPGGNMRPGAPPASGAATAKTAKPGQPNTMTREEMFKEFGVRY